MAGEFEPGQRLTELQLAERLGMSRTPVREALNRLAADGLLQATPQCGVTVPELRLDEIAELYRVREAIESQAARLAAERVTGEELRSLHALCDRMNDLPADDPFAYMTTARTLDAIFHRTLIELSGCRALIKLYAEQRLLHLTIFGQHAIRRMGTRNYYRPEPLGEEHRPVVHALETRDPGKAQAAVHDAAAKAVFWLMKGREATA